MTNMKSTKKALITSALCLLLCVSMLVGATFAWFTDSVSSAKNTIVAGNLDVELEWSADGDTWAKVAGAANIFDPDALWEPGHTEVVYLKVSNLGTLALKYNLMVNVYGETAGINVAGEEFKLSDHLVFKTIEGLTEYANREAAQLAAGTEKGLKDYNGATTALEAGEVDYLTLIVYMPETVGNEANYRGDAVPTIELGVNLFATQQVAESDSFGPDYDEDAHPYDVIATNEAELVEALAAAKTGDVIAISGNVTWTTGAGHGTTPFVTDATYITLVGLDENATFTAIGSGVGPVGIDNGTVIFKNLKIVDESVSYAENSWEFGYLEFRGNTVFDNCEIVNAIMMEGVSATFLNCSFNSNKDSEYAVWVSDGDATFEGCYFTGSRGIKVHEAYGSEVGTVVINNNTFFNLSKKPGMAIGDVNADTTITLTNNTFAGTQAGDQGNYKYETDTDVATFAFADENNLVADHAVSNSAELKAANVKNATIVLAPGTYDDIPTFAEGTTVIGTDGVVFTDTLSGTLNNTTVKNIHIKAGNAQRWSYSKGDIVFEDCTFEATSVYAIHYDGTSGNVTYKNCKIIGWVAIAGGANHITFDGCEIYGNGSYGVIRLYSAGTIKNCTFDVANVNTTDVYQDGIHAVDCEIVVSNNINVNGAMSEIYNISGTGVITEQ